MENSKLVAVVGPTAVGKSDLAMRLAKSFGGELVSADSRQIYRYMDIGTAKPTSDERSSIVHHLVDFVRPDEPYSLAVFLRQASEAIKSIHVRGSLPIIVGGSGQYVWGLLEGWQVPEVPPNMELRHRLEERARSEGLPALYEELSRLDKPFAARIDPQNPRRVIRALEVVHSRTLPSGDNLRKIPPPYRVKLIGLTMRREALYERIDERIDRMIEAGWVEEVERLMNMGYGSDLPSMSSFGYGELVNHLQGEMSLADAVRNIKTKTHRFARQQYNWFRLNDDRIRWFDLSESSLVVIEEELNEWLNSS